MTDNVNHPQHYMSGGMEAIDVIEAFFRENAFLANVFKYIARAGKKTDDPREDLKKAMFYLDREIHRLNKAAAKPWTVEALAQLRADLWNQRWPKEEDEDFD
jgi:hypothetical protein